ncbi:hypothetical protein [Martelella sp. AMO21009]
MTSPQITIGCDVSGQRLDVYLHPAAKSCSFSKDLAGIAALIGLAFERQAFVRRFSFGDQLLGSIAWGGAFSD